MENLRASMEHLNQATGALAESSKKLDGVIEKTDSTMASAKKAADDLQRVLRAAAQGKGLIATLLNDQQLANDLHALITNLRAHGVLFYRDNAAQTQYKPPEQSKPARRTQSR
jgi:ABC-type transporter Mla subunit MlaD